VKRRSVLLGAAGPWLPPVPGAHPVETAQNLELRVNQRKARALGISIPSSVLAQATEVVQ